MSLVTDQGLRPFPVQILFFRPLRAPRLPRLPAGRRLPPAEPGVYPGPRCEAAALRPRDGGADFLLPAPGARPAPRSLPRVPANLPRGRCSAHTQSPTSSLVGSGFRVRTRGPGAGPLGGTPCSPISPSSSSSSSCSISNKTSLFIFCMAPQKAAPNLARSWGSRVPARRGSRRPGAWAGTAGARLTPRSGAAEPSPRPGKPSRSGRRPEPSAQGYHSPPEGSQATEHAQCETRLTAE